ncbi:hypothetical protein BOTBODRAFT_122708 [Botryobasidium botryosum FD-172 SS1]|uniref:Uncharacterized protein n=1 Tax=Botryobasidium botryosum (strain FD-172 SS1) TaxID=930990 RepID=A0A067M0V3_BOTB1|nr:hypothetical protein BOTBODRAFT_122708 [Botryobasidium botryosum FD-172 SS1]
MKRYFLFILSCPANNQLILGIPLQLTIYNLLRVKFISTENWQPDGDVLRCNKEVYGVEREDCVMVQGDGEVNYARLHLMFTCTAFGKVWRVAREEKDGQFILIDSIIRGAYICRDGDKTNYYFVNDLIDNDMYLRLGPSLD